VRPAGLAVPIFGGIQNEAKSVPPPLPPVEPPPVPPARAAAPPAPPPRAPAQPPPRPALLSACALSDDERELAPVVERIANLIQLPLDVHGVAVLMAEYFVEGLAALELADEMEVLLRKERGGAIAAGHEYAPFTSARFGQLLEGCAFVKVRQWSEGGEKAVRARLARDADERRAALPPELAEADGDDELDEGGLTRRERALEEEGEAFRRLKRPEDVAEASAAPEQLAGDVPTPAAFLQGVRGLLSVLERDDPPARGPP
jgi:hypothetical protein